MLKTHEVQFSYGKPQGGLYIFPIRKSVQKPPFATCQICIQCLKRKEKEEKKQRGLGLGSDNSQTI